MKSAFETLQPLGRALMLPLAVLPVAALMMRLGYSDLLNTPFMEAAGESIFHYLGLLFACGVAVGLAKENHGAAGLAGVVFYVVATEGAKALMTVPATELAQYSGQSLDFAREHFKAEIIRRLGAPTGIVSGVMAGWLYNHFQNVKLPDYLAFFGGRRFVPIVAGFSALLLALLIGLGWQTISTGMDTASHVVVKLGALGLFLYGVLNRLLIVTGLHHILNNIAWLNLGSYHGTTGDMSRFFAGDPNAGAFMSGFFPVMMFGLPAACLAMYHTARPERRKEVGGILASMALTAFLTGVTEPIEFSFMFLAPPLYAIHAVLTGLSMVVMNLLGVHLGFGFSAGIFDYVINFSRAQKPLMLLPVGLVYFALYYGIFRAAIVRFDLKTLGRDDAAEPVSQRVIDQEGRGSAYLAALGGADNLDTVDACTTRLRLIVRSSSAIDEPKLKALGAKGFVRPSANALQVVVGPAADQIAGEIRAAMSQTVPLRKRDEAGPASALPVGDIIKGLGGAQNISSLSQCSTRLIAQLANPALADEGALRAAGIRGTARLAHGIHLIIGPGAADSLKRLQALLGS